MGKALIIAEKPSVAGDIAKALGGFKKHEDYYESDQYVLSSAVGHLLEICVPEKFEVKRGKWTFAQLPVIPPYFDLRPIERNEARLKVLLKLIKRADVTSLVNACDAGREGELIFRYIVQYSKAKKPIRRLWLQSMTPAAIRDGFEHLRDDATMRPLADAAVCRSESDWLVGINGTPAMTGFNSITGEFHPTTGLSPALYDLTSLQREANGRFRFSAKNTLGLAQALYEKHKVLTYPRTDSRALPEDYLDTVKKTLSMLGQTPYGSFADQILKSDWVKPNKRIFNNAKVSDHFAIIPTLIVPKHLSEPESTLYDMVTRRFLAVFYPSAEFLVPTRVTRVEGGP